MSSWQLVEDSFVPGLLPWKESLFTVANGYLGTRGSFEEGIAGETRATFINGLFVTPPGEVPLLGAVPDWTRVLIEVDGEPLDLGRRPPAGYRRTLDLRTGLLERSVLWKAAGGGVVRFRFRRLASMDHPHTTALGLLVEALTDPVELRIETGLDASVPSPDRPVWKSVASEQTGKNELRLDVASIDGAHRLSAGCAVATEGDLDFVADDVHPRFRIRRTLARGDRLRLTKFSVYQAQRDPEPAPHLPAAGTSFEQVAETSARAWAQRWRGSAVEVDGDPAAELALRFAAWSLVGSATASDPGAAVGARLLSGFGYRHHVFWDTDIFVVPYFTMCQPDFARNHIAYRYRGLPGARRKAKRYGRPGAFYAWESADTGDEVTPQWTHPDDGEPIRIWTGDIEEHIVADIAWAIDHYLAWTADEGSARRQGAEIVLDGAKYWAGRLELEAEGAHIRGVIGADEYHTLVDDNLFTNAMAAWQLRMAGGWIESLGPIGHGDLLEGLGLSPATTPEWRRLADLIALRRSAQGVWEQHDGFFDLEPFDVSPFQPRTVSMYELLGEQGVERRQVVKQADVVMAMALLGGELGDGPVQAANWDFYWPRTDHGSSLSLAMHSLVASRLGRRAEAYDCFRRAASIDLEDSMGNGRHGVHAATQGGLLQAALSGFAGLHLEDGEVAVDPRLPEHWRCLGFSYVYRGERREEEVKGS